MKSQHSYEQVHIYAIAYRFKASLTNDAEEKAQPVKEAFPNIRIVLGDLDNSKVLEEEAAKADVVIRTQGPNLQLLSTTKLTTTNRHCRCIRPRRRSKGYC
jgi:hypothetical protein